MRIGYFADGPWAHLALERILEAGHSIAFIVARFHGTDRILRDRAAALGVPFYAPERVNDAAFVAVVREHAVDINVSMSFDQILRADIRASAAQGFINCHAGALPFYRGRNVLNWALINGETRFGVTVHDVDDGIDTGDIVTQLFGEIGPDDTYADILKRAYPLCATALTDALAAIQAGRAKRRRQAEIHPVGMYCGRRRVGDEALDWTWPSQRLHNFIRGIATPGPCARCRQGEDVYAIQRSRMVVDAPVYIGTPGEVIGRTADGVLLKTGDSMIEILSMGRLGPAGEMPSPQPARFPIGTRFTRL